MDNKFDLPILLLVFRRPDVTQVLFDEIKKLKPKRLFIGCGCPRKDNPIEKEKVDKVKKIFENIDWDCEIKTLYHTENKGSKIAISESISWFFSQVEEGIILEEDCIPHPSFFNFCQALLQKYRDDKRVMHISGNNFELKEKITESSYRFSKFPFSWGWATWRRAWELFDVETKNLPEFIEKGQIKNVWEKRGKQKYWQKFFKYMYYNKMDAWDAFWVYTLWINNGLSILPNVNLVSNIGFGEDALNCKDKNNKLAALETFEIGEIIHPKFIIPDNAADEVVFNFVYKARLRDRVINRLKNILNVKDEYAFDYSVKSKLANNFIKILKKILGVS